ncbi:hypothetical protein AMELA_G00033530 [Ameiurus melas]|uniref:CBM21 domain-containing protein n=1 Tax=Ameiurus melas TaxID=219545 RepID=A0A7J6B869_AMEME|nr:hypothetical protein AMELA_G00033530 [Ameiurus melas]
MEPVVGELQGLNIGSSNLLGLPEPCTWDSDDDLLEIGGIKPKSSPTPRRRSSLSCSDDDSQPTPSSSRRVSFADTFGFSLVSVKQFDAWSKCDPADTLDVDLKDVKECFLKLLFTLPLTLEELLYRVQEQRVDLESLELLPGTTTLKGTVRVLNLCFDKLVYIRTSLDCWSSHFDLLAEYVPESSQGVMDCFAFKLTLVPPFGEQGARVDFCIRYETPFGTFWANNSGQNYVLFCHEKAKEQDENEKLKKSCLKPTRHSSMTSTTSNPEEITEIILNCGIAAGTEPTGIKEEKIHEEHITLKQEENSIKCSRKSRRKAARMAKLQQYFAQRDEKVLQQTENNTDQVDVPVPAIDEAPLNLSTPQTNVTSLLAEPRKTEGQKFIAVSMDVDRNQVPATQERENISVIHPELIASKSQTRQPPLDSVNGHSSVIDSQLLERSQDKETFTSQPVSLKCQTSEKSIEDNEEDGAGKDAEPRRNGVEWEDGKDLEVEIEEQEKVSGVTSMATPQSILNIDSFIRDGHLNVGLEQQNIGLEQMSEEPLSKMHSIGEEEEIFCGTDSSKQALALNNDRVEYNSESVDREEDVCSQIYKEHVAVDAIGEVEAVLEKQDRDCLNENMDDSASTESLTDDEMELYLLRLKNTQQSGLKDGISMGKRHSISRTLTIPSPMPSISELMDDDQPNALLDNLTNEEIKEPERTTLPPLDEEEEVIEPNLLWFREFFSSDNMPKLIVYTLLFVVFLITAYICDFIACFGLYLLALHWLYFQLQGEPLKGT